MKKLTLYWDNISNFLLLKDVALIPFVMKKYYGYDASILAWNIENELTNASLYLEDFVIDKIQNEKHFYDKLRETDILMVIGTYEDNISTINLYKSLNPSGKIYFKLDLNYFWVDRIIRDYDFNNIIENYKKCDLVSVESRRLHYLLSNTWGLKLHYIPNGYYEFSDYKPLELEERNNTILFAGRIGSVQKNSDILLESFKKFCETNDDWTLELAGGVEPEFQPYLDTYFLINPHLKDRIKLLGYLDVIELEKKLSMSKIFCITSAWEACANVYAQALSKGCYVVTTDVDGGIDMVDYGRYGSVVPIANASKLSETLLEVCNDEFLKEKIPYIIKNARKEFSWINICGEIDSLLK